MNEKQILVEAKVPLAIDQAWGKWSSQAGFASWWTEHCTIVPEPGGAFEFRFMLDAPAGSQGSEGCKVLAVDPPNMLAFTWNAPPHLKTREQHTKVVVTLQPGGDGSQVRLSHQGWPPKEQFDVPGSDWPETFAYLKRPGDR